MKRWIHWSQRSSLWWRLGAVAAVGLATIRWAPPTEALPTCQNCTNPVQNTVYGCYILGSNCGVWPYWNHTKTVTYTERLCNNSVYRKIPECSETFMGDCCIWTNNEICPTSTCT